jgi:hypothetical protein
MFRKEQRKLTHAEQDLVNQVRSAAQDLHDIIDMLSPSRERDVAMTRLEETVMWAEKAVLEAR